MSRDAVQFCSVCRLAGIRLQLLLVFVLHWIAFGLCFVSPTNQTIPTTTTTRRFKAKAKPERSSLLNYIFSMTNYWNYIYAMGMWHQRYCKTLLSAEGKEEKLTEMGYDGDKKRIKWRKLTKWKTKHMSCYYYPLTRQGEEWNWIKQEKVLKTKFQKWSDERKTFLCFDRWTWELSKECVQVAWFRVCPFRLSNWQITYCPLLSFTSDQ